MQDLALTQSIKGLAFEDQSPQMDKGCRDANQTIANPSTSLGNHSNLAGIRGEYSQNLVCISQVLSPKNYALSTIEPYLIDLSFILRPPASPAPLRSGQDYPLSRQVQ